MIEILLTCELDPVISLGKTAQWPPLELSELLPTYQTSA